MSKRTLPPARASHSWMTRSMPGAGLSHLAYLAGSVQYCHSFSGVALKTRWTGSGGAAVGGAVFWAVVLLVMSLILFFFQGCCEAVEGGVPTLLGLLDPVRGALEPVGPQANVPAPAMLACCHKTRLLEDPDMLLHRHQRDGQRLGQLAQGPLPPLQAHEELAAG